MNGNVPHEGRVEIFHDEEWGTVCGSQWDEADARVVCRSLGFSGGVALKRTAYAFGEGSGRIWMNEVDCSGLETDLKACQHAGWGVDETCLGGYRNAAGVKCNDGT